MNPKAMIRALAAVAATCACSAVAETLTVNSANSPYVIDADATYDSVVVNGNGELVVSNKVTLNTGTLYVGDGGKGTMTVTDGSTVNVTTTGGEKESAPFKIANGADSEGHVNLLDGSKLTANYGLFSKLERAKSYLTISNAQLSVNNSIYNTRNIDKAAYARTNTIIRIQQGGSFCFGSFIRNSPGTTTLFQFDGGVCTNVGQYLSSLDGGWLILEGVNGHPIDYAVLGGKDDGSANGYFCLDGNNPAFDAAHVHLTGNGGLRLYSPVNRSAATKIGAQSDFAAVTSDYTGDCVILAKRLTQTAPNQVFSKRNRVVLDPVNGATSVLDLNGFDAECAGIVENDRGYVLNPAGKSTATLTIGADDGDSVLKSLLCQSPVTIRKVGSGTLSLYSDNGYGHAPELAVEAGHVDLYDRSACGYRIYKWVVTDTYGKNPDQIYLRISELELFDKNGATISLAGTAGENSASLKDENLWTDQFFDRTKFDNKAPYFTIHFPSATQIASYRLGTGCDYGTETKWGGRTDAGHDIDVVPPQYDVSMCRDPSDWTVYGSVDGYNWVEIGKVANYKAPNTRMSWGPAFNLDYAAPLTSGALKIHPGATLNVKTSRKVVFDKVVNYGTINYADGATVELQGAAETYRLLGSGTGTPALEKTGDGTACALGDGPATGHVSVAAGTLRLGGNGGVQKRYWRWRVKGMREWWYDPAKWGVAVNFPGGAVTTDMMFASELELYDSAGTRVNGLDKASFVSATVTDSAGGFQCLLDGNNNTKVALYFSDKFSDPQTHHPIIPRIQRDDPSTWQSFVFKFDDDVPSVYSYDIVTANDHSDRDPACWDFAVSDDGENWTVIEDYTEADPSDYVYRFRGTANSTARHARGTYNYGLPLVFVDGLTATDKVCYTPETEVSVGAGAMLDLPGPLTATGNLRIDATQSADGAISYLNFASGGTLSVDNFTRFSGSVMQLPLTAAEMSNVADFAGWQLILNGLPSSKYLRSVIDGHLALEKLGAFLILR